MRSVSSSSTSYLGVLTTSAGFSAATKPTKVARGVISSPEGERLDTSLDPFEILLVNSASDKAATRAAVEAAGTAFTERPALQVWCFWRSCGSEGRHPRPPSPHCRAESIEIPRKSVEIPPTEDSCGLAVRQSVVL